MSFEFVRSQRQTNVHSSSECTELSKLRHIYPITIGISDLWSRGADYDFFRIRSSENLQNWFSNSISTLFVQKENNPRRNSDFEWYHEFLSFLDGINIFFMNHSFEFIQILIQFHTQKRNMIKLMEIEKKKQYSKGFLYSWFYFHIFRSPS